MRCGPYPAKARIYALLACGYALASHASSCSSSETCLLSSPASFRHLRDLPVDISSLFREVPISLSSFALLRRGAGIWTET